MQTVPTSSATEQHRFFDEQGYFVARQLFTPTEVEMYRAHFMRLREGHSFPSDDNVIDLGSNDPLKRYPRMNQMHRWDDVTLKWLLDPRLQHLLTVLAGNEPYAVQSMLYFKPPKARGQALHQDNYYLRVNPGTCVAAWLAIDDCDEANGCLQVIPGTHKWPVLCTVPADIQQSFTGVTVPLQPGVETIPMVMRAGDVLFFNGSLVHGSMPNTTTDRFRRSLIGHYIEGAAEQVGRWYHPVLRFDGTTVELGTSSGSTKCGEWVDIDGQPHITMTGEEVVDPDSHE